MSNEAESSLPKELVYHFRSSPPILTQYSSFEMDDNVTSKSEPVTTPDAHQTPKRPRHKRMKSDDTERPASAQQDRDDSDDHSDVEADQVIAEDEDLDPAAPITHFDWDRLHQQYHDAMNECNSEEVELMQQWASLMEYFRIWAEAGHEHETNRTYQRLQTRTMFVQHEEDKLEDRRNHYINVVRAFESALNLLKANGFR